MQTYKSNYRFRGARSSYSLVSLNKAVPADMVDIHTQLTSIETASIANHDSFTATLETHVNEIQHLLVQLNHRLITDITL